MSNFLVGGSVLRRSERMLKAINVLRSKTKPYTPELQLVEEHLRAECEHVITDMMEALLKGELVLSEVPK